MATQEQSKNSNSSGTKLIIYLFTRQISSFFTIFGRRGSGKTDFALRIAEILHKHKVLKHFATNIDVQNTPFHIEPINNLDALRKWAYDNPGKKLFIFDEVGMGLRRRSPMTSLNIKVIDQFQILRKPKLSFIAITIDPQYVDNAVLGAHILDGCFRKPNWKNPRLALYDDFLEDIHKRFYNVPKTSIAFDTYGTARFTEHGATKKPQFKDKDLNLLWDWSHGKGYRELGLHPMQINRLARKFIKESLKTKVHTSQ